MSANIDLRSSYFTGNQSNVLTPFSFFDLILAFIAISTMYLVLCLECTSPVGDGDIMSTPSFEIGGFEPLLFLDPYRKW